MIYLVALDRRQTYTVNAPLETALPDNQMHRSFGGDEA